MPDNHSQTGAAMAFYSGIVTVAATCMVKRPEIPLAYLACVGHLWVGHAIHERVNPRHWREKDCEDYTIVSCWPCLPCVWPLDVICAMHMLQDRDASKAVHAQGGVQAVVEAHTGWEALGDEKQALVIAAIESGDIRHGDLYPTQGTTGCDRHLTRYEPMLRGDLLAPSCFFGVTLLGGDKYSLYIPPSWSPQKKLARIKAHIPEDHLPTGRLALRIGNPNDGGWISMTLFAADEPGGRYNALDVLADIPAAYVVQQPVAEPTAPTEATPLMATSL